MAGYKRSGSSGQIGVMAPPRPKAVKPLIQPLTRTGAGTGNRIGGGGVMGAGGMTSSLMNPGAKPGAMPQGGGMSANAYANAPWQQGPPQMTGTLGSRPGTSPYAGMLNTGLQAAGYYGFDSKSGGMGGSGGSGGSAGGQGGGLFIDPTTGQVTGGGLTSQNKPVANFGGQNWWQQPGQGNGGQLMNAQGQLQTFGGGGRNGGYYDPGQISFGMSDVGQGQSRYIDPKTGELKTRIGAVNYGALAGIMNYREGLGGAQRTALDNYLRANGMMPSYNGRMIDSFSGPQTQWSTSGKDPWAGKQTFMGTDSSGKAQYGKTGWVVQTPEWQHNQNITNTLMRLDPENIRRHMKNLDRKGHTTFNGQVFTKTQLPGQNGATGGMGTGPQGQPGMGAQGGMGGAGGSGMMVPGGVGGGAGGGSGGLGGSIERIYQQLFAEANEGSDTDRRLSQRAVDTSNRATQDAIQSARLDAARRGVHDVSDLEARIRSGGASAAIATRDRSEADSRRERIMRVLAMLQGAGGYESGLRRDQILAGQIASQAGMNNLNMVLGL